MLSTTITLMVTLSSFVTTPLGPVQKLDTEPGSNPAVDSTEHVIFWGSPTVPVSGATEILEIKSINWENV